MNIQAYFMIIWYILMLPIVFKVLMSLRLEQLFKKGTGRQEIILLYMILTVSISKLFLGYFTDIFSLIKQIFQLIVISLYLVHTFEQDVFLEKIILAKGDFAFKKERNGDFDYISINLTEYFY